MANTHSLDLEYSSSQYAFITDANQTGLDITGDITIEAWIKLEQLPSSVSNNFAIISKWNRQTANESYKLSVESDDKLSFAFNDTGVHAVENFVFVQANTAFDGDDVGVWIHVAATADVSAGAAGVILYVNGSPVANTDVFDSATSIFSGTGEFRVGAAIGSAGEVDDPFDGLVDEGRVFTDIRTPTEISDNYQQELAGSEGNLVAYYKFNNDYTDSQTAGNNDLTGAPADPAPVFSTDVPFAGITGTSDRLLRGMGS